MSEDDVRPSAGSGTFFGDLSKRLKGAIAGLNEIDEKLLPKILERVAAATFSADGMSAAFTEAQKQQARGVAWPGLGETWGRLPRWFAGGLCCVWLFRHVWLFSVSRLVSRFWLRNWRLRACGHHGLRVHARLLTSAIH